eukprot:m.286375 g.286375  ORF g.286375 m.286375 type:complete len:459 (-) comp11562_c0_seq1:314-1690(-)
MKPGRRNRNKGGLGKRRRLHVALERGHAGAHDLVDKQKVRGNHSARVKQLALDAVVVEDALVSRNNGLAGSEVQANVGVGVSTRLRQLDAGILCVKARVDCERLGDDKQGLAKGLDAKTRAALDRLLELLKRKMGRHLKGTSTGNNTAIVDGVLDSTETVVNGVLDLGQSVLVGALDENGHALRVDNILNKGKLVLAKHMLVDQTGVAQARLIQVLNRVHGHATAGECKALHVAALGTAQCRNALLGKHVERDGIHSLLVDDNEALVRAIADFLLELDDLADAVIDKGALGGNHGLALLSRLVKKARVDLGLFILERDIACEDIRILDLLGHVGVAGAVVKDNAAHKTRVGLRLVLHRHDLNHVEVDGLVGALDGEDRVDNDVGQHSGKLAVHFRAERRARNGNQGLTVHLLLNLHLLENAKRLSLGSVKAVHNETGVETLRDERVGLLEELADDKHV